MSTLIKQLNEIMTDGETLPPKEWNIRIVQSDECQSYVAWNERTREGLVIDPKVADLNTYLNVAGELSEFLWLAVVDTHTHADHISAAAVLAERLQAPLVMHEKAPSQRVQLRVSSSSILPSKAAPVRLVSTPGHTPDSLTVMWGPFLFCGDTLLYGDTGRDDLPGGDAEAHYESMQVIKALAAADWIVLPGHDNKGGRASSWSTQLRLNSSLTQERADFVREASSFDVAAPKLLKEALRENFK